MPGKNYVSSIRDIWRVCSGCNDEAKQRVEKFLREVLNTEQFPLTVMDRPNRIGDKQDCRKFVSGDDAGVSG